MFHEEMIRITIDGKPISKDNQSRARSRRGKFFTRPKFREYADHVKYSAMDQYHGEPLEGDLFVLMIFYFKNKVHCDLCNLPKSICDALNGIAWKDDKQIKMAYLQIIYDPNPRVVININKMKVGETWTRKQ